MSPRIPPDIQANLRYLLFETNHSVNFIKKSLGIGRSTIWRLRLSWELFGTPYPPSCCVKGRLSILTGQQVSRLLAYLEDRPIAYLDEMQWFLYDNYETFVSILSLY